MLEQCRFCCRRIGPWSQLCLCTETEYEFCFTQPSSKSFHAIIPLTSRKRTCGFLHGFPTLAGCHTDLSVIMHTYAYMVFLLMAAAYDIRVFNFSLLLALLNLWTTKSKRESKWCTAGRYFFLEFDRCPKHKIFNWNKDMMKQPEVLAGFGSALYYW